jgi:two-component system NtrC family sensor kinase
MGKNAESEVRLQDHTFHQVFDSIRDTMWICTPQGRIIDINPAGVALLGYESKQDLLSVGSLSRLFHSQKNYCTWQKLMEGRGFVKDFEATLVRNNGELIATLLTSCFISSNSDGVSAIAGLVRDITLTVKQEANVHKRNVELLDSLLNVRNTQPKLIQQEKLASIGQLAAGIAHELNNPVGFISSNFTSLKSYISIVKEYITECERLLMHEKGAKNDPKTRARILAFREKKKVDFILSDIENLVAESMEGVARITEIVSSLRNFSRIDHEGKIEQYDINEALESTLTVARNEIKYVAEVEKDFSDVPLIECIGSEINQVLLNIIVNASQAIESQGESDRGHIHIRTYSDKHYVYCEIADNGPGIPKSIISRVFDPFFTTKEAGQGIGLGLNISYDIVVNKHGGDLLVESEPGKGATFTIKLPRASKIREEVQDSG